MSDSKINNALTDLVSANGGNLRGALEDVKCIAKGGMSNIFRARQPALDRYIVVKKLKDELVSNNEMVERFRREARALASVLHQNIAHVYDFVEATRESYIVMEYIEGLDLSTIVEKVGHLPPRLAAGILLGVARGVGYIHGHNLIHRDIKPSNIRITNRGGVKLMDFGIVMDVDNHGLTRPGMMVGSPNYLSPEQVLGDSISPRADLFLMGIVFYEMLTGTRPFKEENGETVFQRIREAKYIPAREMQSQVPAALDKIVRRMLQKNPDKRYASVKELIYDLELFLGPNQASHTEDLILQYLDEEALLTPSVSYSPVDERTSPTPRWSWTWVAAALLLAAVTCGVGFQIGKRSLATSQIASPAPVTTRPFSKNPAK